MRQYIKPTIKVKEIKVESLLAAQSDQLTGDTPADEANIGVGSGSTTTGGAKGHNPIWDDGEW